MPLTFAPVTFNHSQTCSDGETRGTDSSLFLREATSSPGTVDTVPVVAASHDSLLIQFCLAVPVSLFLSEQVPQHVLYPELPLPAFTSFSCLMPMGTMLWTKPFCAELVYTTFPATGPPTNTLMIIIAQLVRSRSYLSNAL